MDDLSDGDESGKMNVTVKWVLIGVAVALGVGLLMGFVEGATGAEFGFLSLFISAFFGVFTGYIGLNLSGNKKTATATDAQRAAALALNPSGGQALLVLFREGFVGSMAGLNVSLDGREVVQLKSPQFTVLNLSPGEHRLSAAFGGLAGAQNNPTEMTIDAAAGQVIAVRGAISMGMAKNTIKLELDPSDRDELRQRLAGIKMIIPAG